MTIPKTYRAVLALVESIGLDMMPCRDRQPAMVAPNKKKLNKNDLYSYILFLYDSQNADAKLRTNHRKDKQMTAKK